MIVINSSPAINLTAALGTIDLLVELYGPVIVPFEVFVELEAGSDRDDTAQRLSSSGIEVRQQPLAISPLLTAQLDLGEAAVIATAMQEQIATVVLDERKARRVAVQVGLEVIGSIGILIQAKHAGKLDSVSAAIERMQAHGAWLDAALVARALELAGEGKRP